MQAAFQAHLSTLYAEDSPLRVSEQSAKEDILLATVLCDMTLRVYTHYDRQSREKQTIEKVREAFRKESAREICNR